MISMRFYLILFWILDKFRIFASVAFMVVVIVIGVPMWWKTTEVYRVPLPYADIQNLAELPLAASMNIGIFTFDPDFSQTLVNELDFHYKNNDFWNIKFIHIEHVQNAENSKTPAALETKILKKFNLNPGDFVIYEWSKLLDDDILITSDRSALIKNTTTSTKIIQFLDLYILQTYKIRNIIDEESFGYKTLSPQPEYDVLISVLIPSPETMDVKWNVRLASEVYLRSFLKSVNQVSNFILKSQWRYQVGFDFPVKQIKDDNSTLGRYFAVSKTTLPHIITAIEKNLGQSISDNNRINIIIYIPPCDLSPLYIVKDDNDENILTKNYINSFISPKWGSIMIYNPPANSCLKSQQTSEKISFNINSNDVMQIILYHLQNLLDIHTELHTNGIKLSDNEQITPRQWEYEAYIRRSAINHIFNANRTLRSLVQLLDNISYIVINDDVGKAVSNSYNKIIKARDYLLSGDLIKASKFAKEAFISSEKAFFDASLLAQLYFPDEQKYAVYIPLFLPIMVPVITSIAALKKYWKPNTSNEKIKIS